MSIYSVNALSYAIITIYNLLSSYILVSPLNPKPKVVTTVDSVITSALGGIVLTCYSLATITIVVNILQNLIGSTIVGSINGLDI